jgi:post-segregation antitoxin (ccd killing protein)
VELTAKTSTTIYLKVELINLAKDSGLNISKTCENALKLTISRLQGTKAEITDALPQFRANFNVVDRAGFEPAASALRTTAFQELGSWVTETVPRPK